MDTLIDVHALGALLGAWREGICNSTVSLGPTRGQWLPYRGMTRRKPPSGGCGLKHCDRQKNFSTKINCSHDTYAQTDFPISLPSNTTCSLLPISHDVRLFEHQLRLSFTLLDQFLIIGRKKIAKLLRMQVKLICFSINCF